MKESNVSSFWLANAGRNRNESQWQMASVKALGWQPMAIFA